MTLQVLSMKVEDALLHVQMALAVEHLPSALHALPLLSYCADAHVEQRLPRPKKALQCDGPRSH
jgi:hypothetical protein